MSCQVYTFDGVLENWEKRNEEDGNPRYVNQRTNEVHEDHPLIMAAIEECSKHNVIKYTAYRAAMKLRTIQKILKLNYVNLANITKTFQEQWDDLRVSESSLNVTELTEIIEKLFRASFNSHNAIQTSLAAELTINFLLKLFKTKSKEPIKLFSVLVILAVLSNNNLLEKYRFLFRLATNFTNFISRTRLSILLAEMAQLPEFFNEKSSFGVNLVTASVENCFLNHSNVAGVHEDEFMLWVTKEPQTLVWLSTFYRSMTSECIAHDTKCSACQTTPIIGFRYQCLICFSYDLCQNCFFTGKISKRHKIQHPLQEHCFKISSSQRKKIFFQRIKNRLKIKKVKEPFLPIKAIALVDDSCESTIPGSNGCVMVSQTVQTSFANPETVDKSCNKNLGQQLEDLRTIISQLEHDYSFDRSNAQREKSFFAAYQPCYRQISEKHEQQLEVLISHLKKLLASLNVGDGPSAINRFRRMPAPFESTPAVTAQRAYFKGVSPIQLPVTSTKSVPDSRTMMDSSSYNVTSLLSLESKFRESRKTRRKDSIGSNSTGSANESSHEWFSSFKFPTKENSHVLSAIQTELDDILQHFEDNFAMDLTGNCPYPAGENNEIIHAAADIANILTDLLDGIAPSPTS